MPSSSKETQSSIKGSEAWMGYKTYKVKYVPGSYKKFLNPTARQRFAASLYGERLNVKVTREKNPADRKINTTKKNI